MVLLVIYAVTFQISKASSGITPEQIFQHPIDWAALIGTWEVLPEESPLAEPAPNGTPSRHRTMLALRKDGTCRIFNPDHPNGSDGVWTFEGHEIFITLPKGSQVVYYIYGIKGDFMITRSSPGNGQDQLWSRVK